MSTGGQQAADVFVVFGITGDLAKVMTFRSLYRLERRGLLDCPIVGVAVDDWTVDQLVERARESIVGTGEPLDEDVFKRLAARFSYVSGDFSEAATYERVAKAIPERRAARLLPGDPAVPLRPGGQRARGSRADEERPRGGGETVRARPRVGARARCGAARVDRRVAALSHRPLPREAGARGDHPPPLREHDARAALEQELRRRGGDHDGGGLRRRGSRTLLRPGRRVARRRRQPPDAGGRRLCDGAAGPRRARDDQGRAGRPLQGRRRGRPGATTSAVSTTGTSPSTASRRTRRRRRTRPSGSRSRTGAGQASRSSSARASGCRSPRPSCGSSSSTRPTSASACSTGHWSRTSWW